MSITSVVPTVAEPVTFLAVETVGGIPLVPVAEAVAFSYTPSSAITDPAGAFLKSNEPETGQDHTCRDSQIHDQC